MQIEIRSPRPGETIRNKTDMAPLAGLAIAGERPTSFDVVVVLDVSGSTEYPSGIDVDGDGVLGETQRSPISSQPDTRQHRSRRLGARGRGLGRARPCSTGLDPSRVHVGVVSFSGEVDPVTQRRLGRGDDALLEQALTPDYAAVRALARGECCCAGRTAARTCRRA